MRALRCTFFNRPRPGTTKMPFFLACATAKSTNDCKWAFAALLLTPLATAKCFTTCDCVMRSAIFCLVSFSNVPLCGSLYSATEPPWKIQPIQPPLRGISCFDAVLDSNGKQRWAQRKMHVPRSRSLDGSAHEHIIQSEMGVPLQAFRIAH